MERIHALLDYLKETPDDIFLNYALALEYIKSNEAEAAAQLLRKVIAADSTYLAAYYQLAKLLENRNKEECILIYKKGIAIAQQLKDTKMLGELREAYFLFSDDEI